MVETDFQLLEVIQSFELFLKNFNYKIGSENASEVKRFKKCVKCLKVVRFLFFFKMGYSTSLLVTLVIFYFRDFLVSIKVVCVFML